MKRGIIEALSGLTGAPATAVTLFFALVLTTPATAQVIELEPDGSTITYSRPTLFSPGKIQPIAAPTRQASAPVAATIRQASQRHDISPELVEAVAWQESRFRQEAVSPKGAHGVMQLMPATARALGVDRDEAAANIDGGAAYLSALMHRYDGDVMRTLAAYNAGPGAVERHAGIPPFSETQAFVAKVLDRLADKAASPSEAQP